MRFVVLPDHPAGPEIVARLPGEYREKVIEHHSGRPWVVGRWADAELVSAEDGKRQAVLLGTTGTTGAALASRLRAARTITDVDRLAAGTTGSVHLLAAIGDRVRAQGSLSTVHQLHHGEVNGVTVAANRPEVIALLADAGIRMDLLALHLLSPYGPPWPLSAWSMWCGVETLAAGAHLDIGTDGTYRVRRWWVPPEPDVPGETAAARLRGALLDAVRARTTDDALVSADLSGGLDSTSLCFLLDLVGARLLTTHYDSADPSNEDRIWAAECRAELGANQHVVVPPDAVPPAFSEVVASEPDLEGPHSFVNAGVTGHLVGLLAAAGVTRHVTGHGADELFQPSATLLHELVRRDPLRSVGHVRAVRSMRRWTWSRLARGLVPAPSYGDWLAAEARRCTFAGRRPGEVGWELPLSLPPWVAADAVDAVSDLLRRTAAAGPEPLAPLPVHHEMLRLTQVNGAAVRQSSHLGEPFGVSFQAPYIDDRVLEVAMSIRLRDRARVGLVKPALVAALRGLVPDRLLDRRTKADASWISYAGLRRYRRELTELWADSRLARSGLVDVDRLRAGFFGPHADGNSLAPLGPTFKCELWLRAAENRTASSTTDRGV